MFSQSTLKVLLFQLCLGIPVREKDADKGGGLAQV